MAPFGVFRAGKAAPPPKRRGPSVDDAALIENAGGVWFKVEGTVANGARSVVRRASVHGSNDHIAIKVLPNETDGKGAVLPREVLAMRMCDEMALQWGGEEGTASATSGTSSASSTAGGAGPSSSQAAEAPRFSGQVLEALLERHSNPERVTRFSRVSEIQQNAQETASVMVDNLGRLLATADNLDALDDKSTSLLTHSIALHRSAREVRRNQCCKEYKLRIICGILGPLMAAGLTLLVLVLTGVINLQELFPGSGTGGDTGAGTNT